MKSYAKRLLACILAIAMVMSSVPAAFASTEGYGTSTASVATDANGTATNPNGSATNPNGSATNPNGSATNPNGSATDPDGSEYVGIEKIEFQPRKVIVGTNCQKDYVWDEETNKEVENYYYYLQNYDYKIYFTNGGIKESLSDEWSEYYDENTMWFYYKGNEYRMNLSSDQSYTNQWGIGLHTVQVSVPEVGYETSYTFEIIESPIENIEFEDKSTYEYTNGFMYSGWNDEAEAYVDYYIYTTTNENYVVTMKNGDEIIHTDEDLKKGFYYNDMYFNVSTNRGGQNANTPWGIGSHEVTATVCGEEYYFNYTIKEGPIESVEFNELTFIEQSDGSGNWTRKDGGHWWFRYLKNHSLITDYTVTLKDGSVIKSELFEENEDEYITGFYYDGSYFEILEIETDQSEDNPWGVGDHEATVTISNYSGPLKVNIIESPIVKIEIEDKVIKEGENGYYSWDYDEETDEEYRYFEYYTSNYNYTVTMQDGTVITNSSDAEYDGDSFSYDGVEYTLVFDDDQSYNNQWGVGTHEVTAKLGGCETTYTITIIDNPDYNPDEEEDGDGNDESVECEEHDLSLDPSDYIDYPSYVAPTCTESGSVIYQCGECSFEKVIEFEATGHEWSEEENNVKEPTCTESGELLQVCVNCDQTKTVEIPATNQHDYVTIIGYEPTCTEDGLSDGEYCVECGIFKIEQTVIPATGHTEVVHAGKAPTCTENGLTDAIYCSVCDEYVKESDSIDPLGHTEVIHAGKAPTCTEHGFTDAVYCSVCEEYVKESDYIEPLGHTEVTIPATPATCLTNGLTAGTYCSVCNETIVEQQAIPAFNHLWDLGTVTKSATCTEEGVFTYTCMNADCDEIKTSVVPATGHKEVTITGKAATCTETGLTDGKKCETCGTVTVAQETIKTLGHKVVVDTAIAPTCTEAGLTAGSHCSVCHTVIKAQEVVKATGHQHTKTVVTTKATTTKNGKLTTKCTDCSEALSTKTIYRAKTVKLSYTKAVYSGKMKSPKVIIKDSKGKTISSKNYTIKKATGRKNVGKYTYKITFKNQYKGTKTLYLTINPKTTSITKKPTAIKKGFTVKWKKVSKQASGYEIMYSTSKNFTKKTTNTSLVKSYKTTSKKITKLKAKKTYYVKVRTYKTVNGKKYYSAWSKVKTVKTK